MKGDVRIEVEGKTSKSSVRTQLLKATLKSCYRIRQEKEREGEGERERGREGEGERGRKRGVCTHPSAE